VIELALQGMTQPIDVSTPQIGSATPEQLKGILPTVEQLEIALENTAEKM